MQISLVAVPIPIPHFFFYCIQDIWFYVEVLDPFGVNQILCRMQIQIYLHSSTCSYPAYQHHLQEKLYFLQCVFLASLGQKKKGLWVFGHTSGWIFQFNSIDHCPTPNMLFYYYSSVMQLEMWVANTQFIIQDYFIQPEVFVFPYEIEDCLHQFL